MSGQHSPRWTLACLAALGLLAVVVADEPQPDAADTGVLIKTPRGPIARYVTGKLPANETSPSVASVGYLHPVYTPSGQIVTDCGPADHRHHRGVFVGWIQMECKGKQADFWGWGAKAPLQGVRIVNRQALLMQDGSIYFLKFSNDWMVGDEVIIVEKGWAACSERRAPNVIDLGYEFTAPNGDVTIHSNPFGGFCYRAKPGGEVEVTGPDGKLDLPNSVFDKPATNWPASKWYDLTYRENGKVRGVAVMDHPNNPLSTWHVHRGIHMLNPCIVAEKPLTIRDGKPLVLRYRIVAHDGDAGSADLLALYHEFSDMGK